MSQIGGADIVVAQAAKSTTALPRCGSHVPRDTNPIRYAVTFDALPRVA